MAYVMTMERPAVARIAEGILRALSTTAAPSAGLKTLLGKTPNRTPNVGPTKFEMEVLRTRSTI